MAASSVEMWPSSGAGARPGSPAPTSLAEAPEAPAPRPVSSGVGSAPRKVSISWSLRQSTGLERCDAARVEADDVEPLAHRLADDEVGRPRVVDAGAARAAGVDDERAEPLRLVLVARIRSTWMVIASPSGLA